MQLELFSPDDTYDPACSDCGARCVSSVEARRRLCDRCISRRTGDGEQWSEDPEAARAYLRGWMRHHYGVATGAEVLLRLGSEYSPGHGRPTQDPSAQSG